MLRSAVSESGNIQAGPAGGRGGLIAFCGIDGCGKTTQLELARGWLDNAGQEVVVTRQPSSLYRNHPTVRVFFETNVAEGGMESLVLLSALDRQNHLRTVVEPALADGKWVLCDRYYYSAEAFFFARGVAREVVRQMNPDIPRPDLTVYLDIPAHVCQERILRRDGKWSSVEERDPAFLEQVRVGFEGAADSSFLKLDGLNSVDALHGQVVKAIGALLDRTDDRGAL